MMTYLLLFCTLAAIPIAPRSAAEQARTETEITFKRDQQLVMTIKCNEEIVEDGKVMEETTVMISCTATAPKHDRYHMDICHLSDVDGRCHLLTQVMSNFLQAQHVIYNIAINQSGYYYCFVYKYGNRHSQQIDWAQTVVQVSPKLIAHNTTAVEGHRAVIFCDSTNSTHIIWRSDRRDVYNDTSIHFYGERHNKMIITAVSRDYDGTYECRAVTAHGATNVTAYPQLTVDYPPSILQHPSNKTVVVGDTVQFQCVATGNPTPMITWKRDGTALDVVRNHERFGKYRIANLGPNSTLEIRDVQREEDTGYYSCQVENIYGSSESKRAYLSINEFQLDDSLKKKIHDLTLPRSPTTLVVSSRTLTPYTTSSGSGRMVDPEYPASGDNSVDKIETSSNLQSSEAISESTTISDLNSHAPRVQIVSGATETNLQNAVNEAPHDNTDEDKIAIYAAIGLIVVVVILAVALTTHQFLTCKRRATHEYGAVRVDHEMLKSQTKVELYEPQMPPTHSPFYQERKCIADYVVESTVQHFQGSVLLISVGPEGGEYREGSIVMTVPAGACLTSQQIKVQYVFRDEPMLAENVRDKEVFCFSGVLVLEPHELQFQVPVELRFPFTAVPKGWIMLLMREEPGKGWKTALSFDGDLGQVIEQDGHCDYDFHTATLTLSHFCGYQWCAYKKENSSSSEKAVSCMLFAKMNSSGNDCEFVLHFCDNCEDAVEKVIQMETGVKNPKFNFTDFDKIDISPEGNLNIDITSSDFITNDFPETEIPLRSLWPKQYCGTLRKVSFSANLIENLATMKRDPKLTVKITVAGHSVTLKGIIECPRENPLMGQDCTLVSEPKRRRANLWLNGSSQETVCSTGGTVGNISLSGTTAMARCNTARSLDSQESDPPIPSSGRGSMASSQRSSLIDLNKAASLAKPKKLSALFPLRALASLGCSEDMNIYNSRIVFQKLSENLGHDWKFLARHLNLSNAEIQNIEADHKGQKEQGYQVLMTWAKQKTATRTALFEALMAIDASGAIFDRL